MDLCLQAYVPWLAQLAFLNNSGPPAQRWHHAQWAWSSNIDQLSRQFPINMPQANLVEAASQVRFPLLRCQVNQYLQSPCTILFNSLDERHLSLTMVTVESQGITLWYMIVLSSQGFMAWSGADRTISPGRWTPEATEPSRACCSLGWRFKGQKVISALLHYLGGEPLSFFTDVPRDSSPGNS